MVKGWDMVHLLESDRDYFYLKIGVTEQYLNSESFLNFMTVLCDLCCLQHFSRNIGTLEGKQLHGFVFNSTTMRYFDKSEKTSIVMSLQRVICDLPENEFLILYKEDTCELY